MRRSLFWLLDQHRDCGDTLETIYATALEQARLADALGFTSLWMAEHHFQALGTAANPAVVLSAIAQHTERIRLGPAVSVLPLRNPIQVAEDYALLDILSGGRLNLGVGTGSQPLEFTGFEADFEGRQAVFDDSLVAVKDRWKSAAAGERGAHSLNVAPLQSPSPPIYVASNREEGAFEVGQRGHSLLTLVSPAVQSLEEIGARVRAHKRGLHAGEHAEHEAEAVVVAFAHAAETTDAARQCAAPALGRFLKVLVGAEPPEPTDLYDKMRDCGTGLFGTNADIADQIKRFGEHGVEHMAFISRFGGMEPASAEQSLRLLAHPPVRGEAPASVPS